MFQELINGSMAVLTRPSVSTFEEHEKDNLVWPLLYVGLAGLIVGIIQALTAPLRVAANADLVQQLEDQGLFEQLQIDPDTLTTAITTTVNPIAAGFSGFVWTILSYLIYLVIVFALGRAFSGTGKFGELAWDIALFSAPLQIISGIVGSFPVPCLGPLVALGLLGYQLYLTYLGIQAGMNVPGGKAGFVILLLILIPFVLFGCACGAIFLLISAAAGVSG